MLSTNYPAKGLMKNHNFISFFDFCIIGGGIVGLATALKLIEKFPDSKLIILEKESSHSQHQTSHNSGVIHSGIYYKPGSLKAIFCKQGNIDTINFCKKHNIKFEKCGKLIVSTSKNEDQHLLVLAKRAKKNGIKFRFLKANQLSNYEDSIVGSSALFVPDAGIVDYKEISDKIEEILRAKGVVFSFKFDVKSIKEYDNFVEIKSSRTSIQAKKLIVCGGLQADRLAKISGFKIDFKIVPFKGEYYQLTKKKKNLVNHLIYPVPDPKLPFLGIHLTKMINNSITVGPNAVIAFSREGYAKCAINFLDIISFLFFGGFWKFFLNNKLNAIRELNSYIFKNQYLKECQKYCPSLNIEDLTSLTFGIRAQMIKNDGSLVHDFELLRSKRMLHICNAPSPAATSAFPIGEYIVKKLQKNK